ncbi:hypothetical protein [Spiroplasma monobiae]|uniref:Uncharacterized protein n=1 Tax=Spiroplasma monobiae MQ-1 TaxID=1336748 RepID=A0A2K9LUR4_SPISQ|nr:hypothetical protein [Spiroplasma monobiae]AUM62788.1 hypothetical protein SMONO_v1c05390 [Spiroplasma monobiae MQ-1]
MYYINLLDDLYCVYNFEDSFLIAKFNSFEDARSYVTSINGIVILNENDKTKFNKEEFLIEEKRRLNIEVIDIVPEIENVNDTPVEFIEEIETQEKSLIMKNSKKNRKGSKVTI